VTGRSTIVTAAALLVVALSGCAGQASQGQGVPASSSAAAATTSPAPAEPAESAKPAKPAKPAKDSASADQIAGAVSSAQAALNQLDRDFAGDDAAAGN
jgi:hypothetical protein